MFDRFRRCTSTHVIKLHGEDVRLRCRRRRSHIRSGVYQTHEHRGKDGFGVWSRVWAEA